MITGLAWGLSALASPPLPSYREELANVRWREVDAILTAGCAFDRFQGGVVCGEGVTDHAIERADAFQRALFHDAGLEYLAGLASKYAGDEREAARRYEAALALDPELVEAWYDLGEIRLAQGRYDDARTAFERVDQLGTDGKVPWLGPWRLAEVAAHQGDADAFEAHLERALAAGFSFRQIEGLPNWKAFYADPAIGPSLRKMLTVYGTPDVERSLAP
ncbi:MAG: tetratricopeptide repeat protein [Alphaproteobacteria bacterium]|nr:tetratricopeptide repeat protein [Alphaproteobacteria bacterium]